MGQRLNIEILKNGFLLANAYYHWSAFSESAIGLTKMAISEFNNKDDKNRIDIELAIDMLEKTGAKLTQEELNARNCIVSKSTKDRYCDGVNRNDGLISITSYGMFSTRYWEEGRVQIDIGTKEINFYVLFNVDDEWLESDEINKDELEDLNININKIPFDEFENFEDKVKAMIEDNQPFFQIK